MDLVNQRNFSNLIDLNQAGFVQCHVVEMTPPWFVDEADIPAHSLRVTFYSCIGLCGCDMTEAEHTELDQAVTQTSQRQIPNHRQLLWTPRPLGRSCSRTLCKKQFAATFQSSLSATYLNATLVLKHNYTEVSRMGRENEAHVDDLVGLGYRSTVVLR